MKLSGPVAYYKYEFRGRTIRLLADLHNDTTGSCPGDPLDYDDNYQPVGTDTNSMTLLRYIDHMLTKGINFYIESPFVLTDSVPKPKPKLSNLDCIDKLTAFYAECLQRDKTQSKYMPKSHIHYVDIRDVYNTKYVGNIRKSMSANPFSGSWLVRQLKTEEDYELGVRLIRFILDHAEEILEQFIGEYTGLNYDIPAPQWLIRLRNMKLVTSVYKGKRVHRVAKQLLKLNTVDRTAILEWCRRRFTEELSLSYQRYREWTKNLNSEAPIMILVPLSSVIMDTYTLARLIYQDSRSDIMFAGLAHIDNYRSFFDVHGKMLVRIMPEDRNMRCIIGVK